MTCGLPTADRRGQQIDSALRATASADPTADWRHARSAKLRRCPVESARLSIPSEQLMQALAVSCPRDERLGVGPETRAKGSA
jgi:hypothetical protein